MSENFRCSVLLLSGLAQPCVQRVWVQVHKSCPAWSCLTPLAIFYLKASQPLTWRGAAGMLGVNARCCMSEASDCRNTTASHLFAELVWDWLIVKPVGLDMNPLHPAATSHLPLYCQSWADGDHAHYRLKVKGWTCLPRLKRQLHSV